MHRVALSQRRAEKEQWLLLSLSSIPKGSRSDPTHLALACHSVGGEVGENAMASRYEGHDQKNHSQSIRR